MKWSREVKLGYVRLGTVWQNEKCVVKRITETQKLKKQSLVRLG